MYVAVTNCGFGVFLAHPDKETMSLFANHITRWQPWHSAKSTCFPPMWPGFDFRTRRHMWIELVSSLLYSTLRGFSPGTLVFPSHQKPTFDLI